MIKAISSEEWTAERYTSSAGFGVRFLALLVDVIIFIPVVILLFAAEYFAGIDLPDELTQLLFIVYIIIWHWEKGATVGKRQTQLRVETLNGRRISLKQSIIRAIPLIMSFGISAYLALQEGVVVTQTYADPSGSEIIVTRPLDAGQFYLSLLPAAILIVDAVWIFFNKENRALHDVLAGTYCRKK